MWSQNLSEVNRHSLWRGAGEWRIRIKRTIDKRKRRDPWRNNDEVNKRYNYRRFYRILYVTIK